MNGSAGLSGAIIWESPGSDATIDALINKLMIAASTVLDTTATPLAHHKPVDGSITRLSLLTYNGIYVIETKDTRKISLPFSAGTDLFTTLLKTVQAKKK
jgi:hypothetical protein